MLYIVVYGDCCNVKGVRDRRGKGESGARNNDGIKSDCSTTKYKVEVDATMTTINRPLKPKG
jgi:hypothetical protein